MLLLSYNRLTKINACIIPEEPDTNEIHQQICNSRDNQVMPKNYTYQRSEVSSYLYNRSKTLSKRLLLN